MTYTDSNWLQVLRRFRNLPKNEPSGFCAPHKDRSFLKMNAYPWRYLKLIFPYKIGLMRAFTSEKKPIMMTSEWLICPVTMLYRLINWKKEIKIHVISHWGVVGRSVETRVVKSHTICQLPVKILADAFSKTLPAKFGIVQVRSVRQWP